MGLKSVLISGNYLVVQDQGANKRYPFSAKDFRYEHDGDNQLTFSDVSGRQASMILQFGDLVQSDGVTPWANLESLFVFLEANTGFSTPLGGSGGGPVTAYGAVWNTNESVLGGASSAISLPVSTEDDDTVLDVTGSNITVAQDGRLVITFMFHTSSADYHQFWLKRTRGLTSDVAGSNRGVEIASADHQVVLLRWVVDVQADDVYALWCKAGGLGLEFRSESGDIDTPQRPAKDFLLEFYPA